MSEIITKGSEEKLINNMNQKLNKPRYFHCYECGCEYNAYKHEYKYVFLKFGVYSNCPYCGNKVRYVDPYYS